MAVNGLELLEPGEAMERFRAMPPGQRVRGLAPDFAQADLARATGHRCIHALFSRGGAEWLHTAHLRPLGQDQWGAISPYGYGGPLSSSDDPQFLASAWEAWRRWAAGSRVLGEFCRFHPETGQHRFFGGTTALNRMTISVDLRIHPVESQYNGLARRKLRRARAAQVRWSRSRDDWLAFGAFYREAMAALGAAAWYLFDDGYFAALAALEGVELCIVEGEGEWLSAGVYLFAVDDPGGAAEYHLGASTRAGQDAGTPFLLQHAATQEAARRGFSSLYLGGGSSAAPDNPLLFHKRCFSRRERPFHTGRAVHDEALFEAFARSRGYDRQSAPPNLLFD